MKELTDNEIIVALNKAWGLDEISIYCADDRGEYIASVKVISVVNLINRLQSQKEALIAGQETLQKALAEKNTEIERLNNHITDVTKMVKAEIKGVEGQWIILQVQS